MNTWLVLIAIAVAAASGVPALWSSRRHDRGPRSAAALQLVAAGIAAVAALRVLANGPSADVRLALHPLLPELTFGVDALSAVFALPVGLLCACAAVFDLGYWRHAVPAPDRRPLRVFAGLLLAALLGVLAARDGIAFLIAWEVMALAAFFLVATEHRRPDVRAASWIYLATTHAGTLVLFAFFCRLAGATGGFALAPVGALEPATCDLLFVLALVGFGLKAGVVPLHFWLPSAHAAAPSHISALMSGVLIKMGVYGVVRTCALLPVPPIWWGQVVVALGALSAIVGVAFAIGQHDLKRLLAYHSIENIGIILLGVGTALLGRATGRAELTALGLAGALLHVWNHGLFKGLLFLAAGATIRSTGTRVIDRLGGIGRRMPWTATAFLCGAVAICGLPPLNGFVSELLTYLGLFESLRGAEGVAAVGVMAIPALALTGAMALLCFVKVFGVVYLGTPRSEAARSAREAEPALLVPMAVLATACAAIGLFPSAAVAVLEPALADWLPRGAAAPDLGALAPLATIGWLGAALVVASVCGLAWLRTRRGAGARAVGTWDCGYARAEPSVQYTAASFAQMFVQLTRRLLVPRTERPGDGRLFPAPASFHTEVPDLMLDRVLLPVLRALGAACQWLRLLQRGRVQIYLLYVFVTLLVLLLLE